jgi:hypothetical protein
LLETRAAMRRMLWAVCMRPVRDQMPRRKELYSLQYKSPSVLFHYLYAVDGVLPLNRVVYSAKL